MLQAQPFYQRQKRLIWLFVMARIGHGLRGRYQFAKELPPILLSLIRTLEALEGNSSFGYAPPLEGRGVADNDWLPPRFAWQRDADLFAG